MVSKLKTLNKFSVVTAINASVRHGSAHVCCDSDSYWILPKSHLVPVSQRLLKGWHRSHCIMLSLVLSLRLKEILTWLTVRTGLSFINKWLDFISEETKDPNCEAESSPESLASGPKVTTSSHHSSLDFSPNFLLLHLISVKHLETFQACVQLWAVFTPFLSEH